MRFLKRFIGEVANRVGNKILANPLAFLGVTGFMIIANTGLLGEVVTEIDTGYCIGMVILYIMMLGVFMDKPALKSEGSIDTKNNENTSIRQNNISLISFFKNKKK